GRDSAKPSEGKAKVSVDLVGDGPPAREQVAAYQYLKDHEAAITEAVVERIFEEYPELRRVFQLEFDDSSLPEIHSQADLRNLIGLGTLHVLNVAKGGQAYIGFEFGCVWDEEHGAGVMTHKERVVEFGGADMAFLDWVGKKDGGKPIGASNETK